MLARAVTWVTDAGRAERHPRCMEPRFDSPRLAREWATVDAMIHDFCRLRHDPAGPDPLVPAVLRPGRARPALCASCAELRGYALRRLRACVFADEKPTCSNCPVHCYGREMRDRMREVMRVSGPRLSVIRPWLALMHGIDGRRRAPDVRACAAKRLAEKKAGRR